MRPFGTNRSSLLGVQFGSRRRKPCPCDVSSRIPSTGSEGGIGRGIRRVLSGGGELEIELVWPRRRAVGGIRSVDTLAPLGLLWATAGSAWDRRVADGGPTPYPSRFRT